MHNSVVLTMYVASLHESIKYNIPKHVTDTYSVSTLHIQAMTLNFCKFL